MTREIELTQGQVALVDDQDFNAASAFRWCANRTTYDASKYYAARAVSNAGHKTTIYLHRFIIGAPAGVFVDHKNRDTLDCRRENLRLATRAQNNTNRIARTSKTYRGVDFTPWCRLPWRARVQSTGGRVRSGGFATELEAAIEYDRLARAAFGEFALLNFPDGAPPVPAARTGEIPSTATVLRQLPSLLVVLICAGVPAAILLGI